ncbi:MAG TPA: hypothetical protein VFB80_01780 [Pirellulaceae bacterium]|nr:hypothetical protein [Pirellulaceae bacterium]
MFRWSLRSLFILLAVCGVASRVASEAVKSQDQQRILEKLQKLGPLLDEKTLLLAIT